MKMRASTYCRIECADFHEETVAMCNANLQEIKYIMKFTKLLEIFSILFYQMSTALSLSCSSHKIVVGLIVMFIFRE